MTSPSIYIEVAIALPVYNTYTYSVPETFQRWLHRKKGPCSIWSAQGNGIYFGCMQKNPSGRDKNGSGYS